MKLHNAIVMGKFCGLSTVEECIENIKIHWDAFTKEDIAELAEDINLYYAGKLKINWDLVEMDVEFDEIGYHKYCEENNPHDENCPAIVGTGECTCGLDEIELFGDLAE